MRPTTMSHMHHIDGLSTAAAQYQAYLERMRLANAKDEEKGVRVRPRNGGQKFEEELDSEEENSEEDPQENPEETEAREAAQEAPEPDVFGSHYA